LQAALGKNFPTCRKQCTRRGLPRERRNLKQTDNQTNATNFIQFHFAGCGLPVIVRRSIGTPENSRQYLVNKAGTL
jgi:hypothetical protein